MAKKDFDYAAARQELQQLLEWFESGSADLDKALANYKRAEELLSQIDTYLTDVDKKLQITIHKTEK